MDQFDWSFMFDAFVMLIQALQKLIEFSKYHLQLFDASHITPSITLLVTRACKARHSIDAVQQ
jgi:hypothetical protein